MLVASIFLFAYSASFPFPQQISFGFFFPFSCMHAHTSNSAKRSDDFLEIDWYIDWSSVNLSLPPITDKGKAPHNILLMLATPPFPPPPAAQGFWWC